MKRLLAVGFGLGLAVAGVFVACGGDDSTGGTTAAAAGSAARARLIVPLRSATEIEANALAGTFDIVIG